MNYSAISVFDNSFITDNLSPRPVIDYQNKASLESALKANSA